MMTHEYTALARIASIVEKPVNFRMNRRQNSPRQLVFTDPDRNPAGLDLLDCMAPGSALVYRHFGASDRLHTAQILLGACRHRDIALLVGADPQLAARIGADGVHLPERMIRKLPGIRSRFSFRQVSAAAHSVMAARNALRLGADLVVVSSVFPSPSPSAPKAMGVCRFALACRQTGGPVVALGGINPGNVRRLSHVCAGVAMVSAARG